MGELVLCITSSNGEELEINAKIGNKMTNQEIIDAGQVIFDEESVGANTSERVGAVIKGIGQNLIAEENARTSADTDLGHRIDDEETARLAAESGLGGEIDAEIAARQEADTALGARIDREASARVSADAALGERIDGLSGDLDDEVRAREDAMSAEEAARQSGDDNLGDAISAETAARQQSDTALGGRIDTEKAAREAADTALGGRIDTEKAAREAADTALGEQISDLSDGLDDEAATRATAINNETSAREQADIALGARIDAEKAAREAADGELGTRITGLSDGLVAEVSAREAADINLQNSINLEAATRESLDEKLDIRDHAGEKLATASVSGSGSASFSVFYNFVAGHEYIIRIDIDAQTVSTIRAWGEGGAGKSTIAENATLMAGENYFKYTADEGAIRVNVNNVSGRTLTMSVYDYNSDVVNWLLDSMRSLPELAGNYTSSNRDSKVDAGVYANNSEQPGILFVKTTNGENPVQQEIITSSAGTLIRERSYIEGSWTDWVTVTVVKDISELKSTVSSMASSISGINKTVVGEIAFETSQGFIYYSDGTLNDTNTDYVHSGKIGVSNGENYHIKAWAGVSVAVVAFYDSSNAYISGIAGQNSPVSEWDVTVPDGAAFMIVSNRATGTGVVDMGITFSNSLSKKVDAISETTNLLKEKNILLGVYSGAVASTSTNVILDKSLEIGKKYRFVVSTTSKTTSGTNIRPRLMNSQGAMADSGGIFSEARYVAKGVSLGLTSSVFDYTVYDYRSDFATYITNGYDELRCLNINNAKAGIVTVAVYEIEESAITDIIGKSAYSDELMLIGSYKANYKSYNYLTIELNSPLEIGKKYVFSVNADVATSSSNICAVLDGSGIVLGAARGDYQEDTTKYLVANAAFTEAPSSFEAVLYNYKEDSTLTDAEASSKVTHIRVNGLTWTGEKESVQVDIYGYCEEMSELPIVVDYMNTGNGKVRVCQRYGTTDRWLGLDIQHDVDTSSSYKDVWRIMGGAVYQRSVDGQFFLLVDKILHSEENEMAIGFDFGTIGGTHGFERIDVNTTGDDASYLKFFADGKEVSVNDLNGLACKTFKYVQYSTLHEMSSPFTIVAYHLKETVFCDCGYKVTNTVKFAGSQTLNSFFAGLVCIGKSSSSYLISPTGGVVCVDNSRLGALVSPIGKVVDVDNDYLRDVNGNLIYKHVSGQTTTYNTTEEGGTLVKLRQSDNNDGVRFPYNENGTVINGYPTCYIDPSIESQDMWHNENGVTVHISSRMLAGYENSDVDHFYNMSRPTDTKYYRVARAEKSFVDGDIAKSEMTVLWKI